MKNSILLILSVISCFVLSNCKKDCLGYKDYEVKFFTNHKDYSVIESTFETVTEHHLKVATHRQGAVLETVIEQVLHKSAHTQKTILDSQEVHIVLNAETNTLDNIQCYNFYPDSGFKSIDVPAEYRTRSFQKVLTPGNGPEIPAIYATSSHMRLITDSRIQPNLTPRIYRSVSFRIPDNLTIEEYLEDQLSNRNYEGCLNGNSYEVVK